MTKGEKCKATKKANEIYKHYFILLNDAYKAYICSRILINELIANSNNESIEYWQYVQHSTDIYYTK